MNLKDIVWNKRRRAKKKKYILSGSINRKGKKSKTNQMLGLPWQSSG